MKVPLTSSAKKRDSKFGSMRFGTWNCFGTSGERLEYLMGSEDGRKAGLYPSGKDGGHWVLALQECRIGGIERLEKHMPSGRVSLSEPATDTDKASGVALVLSPALSWAVRDKDKVGSHIAWVQLETEVDGVDIIAVNVYIPHHRRQSPSADDVYGKLEHAPRLLGTPRGVLPVRA